MTFFFRDLDPKNGVFSTESEFCGLLDTPKHMSIPTATKVLGGSSPRPGGTPSKWP